MIRHLDHIAGAQHISCAKRDFYPHAGCHAVCQALRNPVAEGPIHFFMGDIHDHLRKFFFQKEIPLSFKISAIKSLSSIGYFTPLIS